MNVYIPSGNITDMQGPCPSGFHVPLITEWQGLKTIMDGLGLTTGDGWRINLHMPFAGRRYYNSSDINLQGSFGYYWSSSPNASYASFLYLDASNVNTSYYDTRVYGFPIRCFKNLFELPTASWTVINGTLGSAGIFRDTVNGIISITSDGTTGYTIQDKNLGATTVYNNGDTLTQANMGNMYQWGNNYGFPSTGSVTTSSTQVDASTYGPGNYYSSSTFITRSSSPYDWSSVQNDNLRGGETGPLKMNEIKNAYIGDGLWNGDLSKASSSNRKSATVSRSGGYGYVGIFSSDGTIYTVQYGDVGYTDQYRLSTAWDITTIGSSFYSMSKQGSTSYAGGCFGNNGRIFLTRSTGGTFIKYTLSTPRLLSTRDSGTSMTIGDVSGAADQYCFSEDGTKFIYSNDGNKKLEQSTNTAWSVTGTGTVLLTGTGILRGTFDTYGDYFYLIYSTGTIKKYKLPNKYDLTGMTEQQSISLSIGTCCGLAFDTLGNNMYVLVQGYGTQTIYQYTLS